MPFIFFVTTSGGIGELANLIINGLFVATVGMIYKFNKTKKGAYLSLLTGTLVLVVAAVVINLYLMLPLYMPQASLSSRLNIVLTIITPFNFVRGAVLSAVTLATYKRLSPLLHK